MVQNMTAPMGTGWRATRDNDAPQPTPVAHLGDSSWQARPTTAAFIMPPASTGAPGWRPSRAD